MVFWPKLPKFLAKLNFDFLLHNFSRYVIFRIFCKFFARKVLGDMARIRRALQTNGRTHGRTDGRTDNHGGKNNICLPQGETYNTWIEFDFWVLYYTYLLVTIISLLIKVPNCVIVWPSFARSMRSISFAILFSDPSSFQPSWVHARLCYW